MLGLYPSHPFPKYTICKGGCISIIWVSSKHLTCNCSCLIELIAQRYPPKLMALFPDTLETVYLQSHFMRGSSSMNRAYTHQVMCFTASSTSTSPSTGCLNRMRSHHSDPCKVVSKNGAHSQCALAFKLSSLFPPKVRPELSSAPLCDRPSSNFGPEGSLVGVYGLPC